MPLLSTVHLNIAALCREGQFKQALHILRITHNAPENYSTFLQLLQICMLKNTLSQVKKLLSFISQRRFSFATRTTFHNKLIYFYVKCGSLVDAREVFDRMKERDGVSWNTIITAYRRHGYPHEAITLFHHMQQTGLQPDKFTFASVLPACAEIGALKQGMDIHHAIKDRGFLSDVVVSRYVQNGFDDKALEVFKQMQLAGVKPNSATIASILPACARMGALEQGAKPNSTTFASILRACAQAGALEQGMAIHQSIKDSKLSSDVLVTTALLDMYAKCGGIDKAHMYAKCGTIDKAHELFNGMPERDVISWNAMIRGYAQNGFNEKALKTFKQMQLANAKPDSTTFASILPACAKMGTVEHGYAQNGYCKDALKIFELMKHSGTYPDSVSFVCVLFACSHGGFVDKGCTYFNNMSKPYHIKPSVDHHVCMVDLLARAGYLEDTLNFIIKMPFKPVLVVWMSLLGACRSHVNIGLGVFTARLLFDLDPKNAAIYVLLSNIYAEMERWGEVQIVRRLMKDRGIKKIPGCSWIEGHKMVHFFCVGDRSHPQNIDPYKVGEIC
ncbi:pentatricopeptide repeat-containing protein At2g03880, mitochondrial [Cryptomeria japonica]|uniref:pentatricopeptide repeat-containing protein At2g03880, mitochondrial n=1 Tax=Cryptomeria japonica TaxID=3369 RepID=UPI0027DA068F|nr:pentatricopeptide repeat-containing protein At2g03880, mitochondrial [Cryptomeria japonica]